jgi:hypothetical protein
LRKANWQPRKNAKINSANPKTLKELDNETKKEAQRKEMALHEYQSQRRANEGKGPHYRPNDRSGRQNNCHNNGRAQSSVKAWASFDMSKINFAPQSGEDRRFAPQWGGANSMSTVEHKLTMASKNPFANLTVDCDDHEDLSMGHQTRSNGSNKTSKKEKLCRQQHIETPSPEPKIEKQAEIVEALEIDDDCFFIDMSEQEEESKTEFAQKLAALLKTSSYTMFMMSEDIRKMNITPKVIAAVLNEYLDKREAERHSFIEVLVTFVQKGLVSKRMNLQAFGLLGKLVPGLLLDIPDVCGYIGDFCCK